MLNKDQVVLKKTLEDFGIECEMKDTLVGPLSTTYTLELVEKNKLSHVITLANENTFEIALSKHPVKISAPIPGTELVGIEVPNNNWKTYWSKLLLQFQKWCPNWLASFLAFIVLFFGWPLLFLWAGLKLWGKRSHFEVRPLDFWVIVLIIIFFVFSIRYGWGWNVE